MIRMGRPGIIMLAHNIMTREPTCCGHIHKIVDAEFDILEVGPQTQSLFRMERKVKQVD